MLQIQIYVACLASYNNGDLYGKWIDADQDVEDIRNEIAELLRGSKHPNVRVKCPDECENGIVGGGGDPMSKCGACHGEGTVPSAEEWAIHDYDGFGSINMGEHPDLEQVAAIAHNISEHGDAFIAFVSDVAGLGYCDADDWEQNFQDAYAGTFNSKEAYAEQFIEETCNMKDIPDIIRNHIDYEGIARDMELGGDMNFVEDGGEVHVFNANW